MVVGGLEVPVQVVECLVHDLEVVYVDRVIFLF